MRKVTVFNHISLDGFFEGPGHDIGWTTVDEEIDEYSHNQMDPGAVLLLFGRLTYELMAGFWPTAQARQDDPITADYMNSVSKIVFSNTLEKVGWENTRLVKGDAVAEIKKLKQQPGEDFLIFGSSDLISGLMQEELVDEIVLLINPVILGSGKPHFHDLKRRFGLKLLETRTFHSAGVVLLRYEVLKA